MWLGGFDQTGHDLISCCVLDGMPVFLNSWSFNFDLIPGQIDVYCSG